MYLFIACMLACLKFKCRCIFANIILWGIKDNPMTVFQSRDHVVEPITFYDSEAQTQKSAEI